MEVRSLADEPRANAMKRSTSSTLLTMRATRGPRRALAVDAQAEVVNREVGFVFGLAETGRELRARDAERHFAAGPDGRNSRCAARCCPVGEIFDLPVIDGASVCARLELNVTMPPRRSVVGGRKGARALAVGLFQRE